MSSAVKRTFTLPEETVGFVDKLVASGAYASEAEVVQAGLEALRDQNAEIERWLREDVVPVANSMRADPSRGIPIEKVRKSLREHHAPWVKASGG